MDPRCLPAHCVLGAAYLRSGRAAEALAAMEQALDAVGEEPALVACLAHARAVTGRPDVALDLVRRLEQLRETRHVPGYHLALAHVGLGDEDAAFAALEQATVDCDPVLANIAVEPRFEPLHDDPRFARLVDLLGL
jgi:Flp pilus assembly protein TadD